MGPTTFGFLLGDIIWAALMSVSSYWDLILLRLADFPVDHSSGYGDANLFGVRSGVEGWMVGGPCPKYAVDRVVAETWKASMPRATHS